MSRKRGARFPTSVACASEILSAENVPNKPIRGRRADKGTSSRSKSNVCALRALNQVWRMSHRRLFLEPKNGSFDLSKKWLKPSTGACFQLFLSTAPWLAKNLLKRVLARLSADFTRFLKIHLIGDWAKPARMAIHGDFEPIAWRQLPFLGWNKLVNEIFYKRLKSRKVNNCSQFKRPNSRVCELRCLKKLTWRK